MSVYSSRSGVGSGIGKLCVGCGQSKLRSNELHDSCFDCLGHGPQTPREQRCDICRHWVPRHFVGATHYYQPDSPSRIAALALQASVDVVNIQLPSNEPFTMSGMVGSVVEPEKVVLASMAMGSVPPTLSGTAPPISQEDSSLLVSLLSILKGPQLPGLSALLQKGVPVGNAPGSPGRSAVFPQQAVSGNPSQGHPPFLSSLPIKRSLDSVSMETSEAFNLVKKTRSVPVGQLADVIVPQGTTTVQVEVHTDREGTETERPRSHSRSEMPFTQAGGPDRSDQNLLLLPPGAFSGLSRDRYDRAPRMGLDQGKGQSSSGAFPDHEMDGADRGCDRQPGHRVGLSGQTRPNGTSNTNLPFPSSDRGGRSRKERGTISVPWPTKEGASMEGASDPNNDVEMVFDDRADRDTSAVDSNAGDSVFRWALGSIALRMGEEQPIAQPAIGKGAFQTTPVLPFIQLPVGSVILRRMAEINQTLANHVEPTKSDGWVPQISVSSDQQKIYATRPTGDADLTCSSPSEDRLLGALRKQTAPVWSAYVKKARLLQWQNATHQLLGQLSLMENLSKFVGDLLLESSMVTAERDQVMGALKILSSTLASSEKLGTNLAAHLDLTVRDAELRLLEVSPFQQAMFRSSPLFSGELFNGITRSVVEDITSSRMMTDIHSLAQKGGPKTQAASSKGKKAAFKAADQPSRVVQPFRGQAAVPTGQQPGTQKKGGKGGKGKNKSRK